MPFEAKTKQIVKNIEQLDTFGNQILINIVNSNVNDLTCMAMAGLLRRLHNFTLRRTNNLPVSARIYRGHQFASCIAQFTECGKGH